MKLRALLVDDEAPNLALLQDLLSVDTEVDVVGTCRNGQEAVEAIRRLRPDVVFLDIQMPGLDGFEVLEELEPDARPLVVFVTAYDQYSLQAFEVHALDYLLKPVSPERLQAAVDHVRQQLSRRDAGPRDTRLEGFLEALEQRRERPTRFVVREGERVWFIRVEDVDAIEATGNYMHLFQGRKSHIIRDTLGNLETRLDPRQFIRTHRSWMLNVDRIHSISPSVKGAYVVLTHGGLEVPVSDTYRDRIMWLVRSTMA